MKLKFSLFIISFTGNEKNYEYCNYDAFAYHYFRRHFKEFSVLIQTNKTKLIALKYFFKCNFNSLKFL